ncbi:MAG: thiamine phosphate synthase [Moraxella sp.]|uniref:thiamine phosphate synthase n=1 Tax=Moraxella sp. TaxID=479 RepID=UPI0026DBC0F8|nr:thiamine phosphate synthase [Moraxella sp.]MDO4450389.1 thiamine phosphate synthase [Moraxella sp.]
MTTKSTNTPKIVPVAVAVLRYGELFLLATRLDHQHQGGKLEFVGGKIEQGETPNHALIREVGEELGLDISHNVATKLGRIGHDYGDKIVRLFVYQIWLNDEQYLDFKDKKVGNDGQHIGFYDKGILSQTERFPTANAPILNWLALPSVITISRPLSEFEKQTDWLDFYLSLPKGRTLMVRTQADHQTNAKLIHTLSSQRADLRLVVSLQDIVDNSSITAVRLTQNELMTLDLSSQTLPNLPVIASCHDEKSIQKINALAKIHPVMAVMISPVLPTQTHPNAPHLGWEDFAHLAEIADAPVIALGGLSPSDVETAYQHGAVAVAGIRAFL